MDRRPESNLRRNTTRPPNRASSQGRSDLRSERRPPVRQPVRPPVRQPARQPVRQPARKRRAPKRVRRDYTLIFLNIIAAIGGAIAMGGKRLVRSRYFRPAVTLGLTALMVVAIVGIIRLTTRPNGLEVFLDDVLVGVVRFEGRRAIDHDYIIVHATTRLETAAGSAILISSEITTNPVRVRDGLVISFDGMMAALVRSVDYYVYGAMVSVDGDFVVSLSSLGHAEYLLAKVVAPHVEGEGAEYIDYYEFVENVVVTQAHIHRDDLDDPADALTLLTAYRPVRETHRVQSGDTLYVIARDTGMGMTALLAANPGVDEGAFLQIGQTLTVTRMLPVLSVRTFQRVVIEEAIPMPVENLPVGSLAPGLRNIVQQGRDGLQRVTIDIVRVNGEETERRIVGTEVLEEPIAEIAQVGV